MQENKATLFFEFFPELWEKNGEQPLAIFSFLLELGYRHGLFYNNFGLPVEAVRFEDCGKLEELAGRIGTNQVRYYDIMVPGRSLPAEAFSAFCRSEAEAARKILTRQ